MKKRFLAVIDGKETEFLFEVTGESSALLVLNGEETVLDIARVGGHDYSVLSGGRAYDLSLARDGERVKAAYGGGFFEFTLVDEKKRRRSGGTGAESAVHSGDVVSPMPGKVVKVHVTPGQAVKAGEGIAVVEAMKMENEFKSPKDGVVKKVNAKVGDSVEGGAVLAVIE
jgi:biotin carboxyl carrier protein